MNAKRRRIEGRMELVVRDKRSPLVERRTASNLVLRGGAEVVARLFSGKDGGPVNRIGVGFGQESLAATGTTLTPPADAAIPSSALTSPLSGADCEIDADGLDLVRVRISAVFKPSLDLPGVSEAGLLSGETLYNQVVFEPVTLRVGQDITFFWEIDFPFGH